MERSIIGPEHEWATWGRLAGCPLWSSNMKTLASTPPAVSSWTPASAAAVLMRVYRSLTSSWILGNTEARGERRVGNVLGNTMPTSNCAALSPLLAEAAREGSTLARVG